MDARDTSTTSKRRRALAPALTLLVTAAVVAGAGVAGVAGAADSATVYVTELGSCYRFTETAGTPCTDGELAEVTIETGEVVTWDFNTGSSMHNVASTNDVADDPDWTNWSVDPSSTGTYSRQFMHAGTYEFVCQIHLGMEGTVTVIKGDGPVTPIPTRTATPTATATATPTPTGNVQASPSTDDHLQTPAPGHGAKDTVAPKVQTMRLRARARELDVRYWLSEPATVTITATRRGSKTKLASTTVQSPAGTRTVKLRSRRFTRGTYTVALRVTDAMGNKATAAGKNVRLRSSR